MKRRYAEGTTVQVARTRGQIDELLRDWGCRQIQWTDDYDEGRVMLRFVMNLDDSEDRRDEAVAKISLYLRSEETVREESVDGRSGRFSKAKFDKAMNDRGRAEHRLLLLWIKAALNAVEAGLLSTLEVFLPFVEGKDGQTIGEVVIPRLQSGERNLLPSGI